MLDVCRHNHFIIGPLVLSLHFNLNHSSVVTLQLSSLQNSSQRITWVYFQRSGPADGSPTQQSDGQHEPGTHEAPGSPGCWRSSNAKTNGTTRWTHEPVSPTLGSAIIPRRSRRSRTPGSPTDSLEWCWRQ